MGNAIGYLLAAALLGPLGAGNAQDPADESLRLYAVNIVQNPPQSWAGYGDIWGKAW